MFLKGSTWESRVVVVFSVAHISQCSVSLIIDNVTKHRSSRILLIVSEAANKQQRKAS